MMSNLAKGTLAIALVIWAQRIAFGSSRIPRADALAQIAHTAELVRGTMNSDPHTMQFYLYDGLMDTAGDDPRAIALCKEVIEKSTNPVSVATATRALSRSYQLLGFGPVHGEWHLFTSSKRAEEIAVILREAWGHSEPDVKLAAASALSGMGGKYREEGRQDFKELLKAASDKFSIYDMMSNALGLDQEALDFFDGWIASSTTTQDATRALEIVMRGAARERSWSDGIRANIANVLRNALRHRLAAVQLAAASDLKTLGGSYAKEARVFLEKRLREPLGADPDNTGKWAFIRIISSLADSKRSEDAKLVKEATSANPQVLSFYEAQIAGMGPGNREYNSAIFQKWKAIAK